MLWLVLLLPIVLLLRSYWITNRSRIHWVSLISFIYHAKNMHYLIKELKKPLLLQHFIAGNHVIICDQKIMQDMLKNDKEFPKNKTPTSPSINQLCDSNIFNSNGVTYHRHKDSMLPFLRSSYLDHFIPMYQEKANLMVNLIEPVTDINDLMIRTTLDIIGETLLGVNLGALSGEITDMSKALSIFMREITNPVRMVYPGFDQLSWLQSNIELKWSLSVMKQHINSIIHRKSQETHTKKVEYFDLLNCMLDRPETVLSETFGNIIALIVAGHETTATSLTWACYFLSLYPEIQQKVYEEEEDVYLEKVIKETLRIMPPVGLVPGRQCPEETLVTDSEGNEYLIPKDSYVSYSIWSVHRDPKIWNEPDKFNPDRFDQPVTGYLPFSAGKRPCIGREFSMLEQKIILKTLLSKYRILPPDHKVEFKAGIFCAPEQMKLKFISR